MNFLLDTHAFIWFFNGDTQLSESAIRLITNAENKCFLSIASIWEIGIKTSLGKLELRGDLAEMAGFMKAGAITLLPIELRHIQRLQTLPFHHRDPFDRLLIAQALTENLTLISRDGIFSQYSVPLHW